MRRITPVVGFLLSMSVALTSCARTDVKPVGEPSSDPNQARCKAGHYVGLLFTSPAKTTQELMVDLGPRFRGLNTDVVAEDRGMLVILLSGLAEQRDGILAFAHAEGLNFEVEDRIVVDSQCKVVWDHPTPPKPPAP